MIILIYYLNKQPGRGADSQGKIVKNNGDIDDNFRPWLTDFNIKILP